MNTVVLTTPGAASDAKQVRNPLRVRWLMMEAPGVIGRGVRV